MIKNLTDGIDFDAEAYLYWIRLPEHSDISTQGYVGITSNPKRRLTGHNHALASKKGTKRKGYSKKFVKHYDESSLLFEVVNCGSRDQIQQQEYMLRPDVGIGWNVAVGGEINGVCSRYKHGGTSNLRMYNMLQKFLNNSKEGGIYCDFNFETDSGFKLFMSHLPNPELLIKYRFAGIQLIDDSKGFIVGNYRLKPKGEFDDHAHWVYFEGRWWSREEACLHTGVSVDTATKRISSYGMTKEEAVGFKPFLKKCFEVVLLDGVECLYDSSNARFSKDDLVSLYEFYKTGKRGFKAECQKIGVSDGNMLRYFKRYGLRVGDRRTKEFINNK